MPDVGMPRLSDSMREGAVSQWLVEDGAEVSRGQEILEVETDKATMAYEAEHDGVLRILVAAGVNVEVGQVIATIGEPDSRPAAPAPSVAEPARSPRGSDLSPLLRRLAQEHGVDPASVRGSGPGGKVLRSDIVTATASTGPDPAPAAARTDEPRPPAAGRLRTALTRSQQLVAVRMSESRRTIPDFWASVSLDVTRLLELRADLEVVAAQRVPSVTPTLNDFMVKACALALVQHPRLNAAYEDGHLVTAGSVDIGVAVATDAGLLVPVVRSADRLGLLEIAQQIRSLATSARLGKIAVADLEGGTFTVSNLGGFGVRNFAPIINGHQAAILGVGAATPTVVPFEGAITVRSMLEVTLTSDHRIVYGADAARFLQTLKQLVEAPALLLSATG